MPKPPPTPYGVGKRIGFFRFIILEIRTHVIRRRSRDTWVGRSTAARFPLGVSTHSVADVADHHGIRTNHAPCLLPGRVRFHREDVERCALAKQRSNRGALGLLRPSSLRSEN